MSEEKPKVAICLPSMNTFMADTTICLMSLVQYEQARGTVFCIANTQCSTVSLARNQLVFRILRLKPAITHILFIDSDQTFPHTLLEQLLAHDKDVVGPFCPRRIPPYSLAGKLYNESDILKGGLCRAEHMAHGMVLIKRSVFERLEAPWYFESFDPAFATDDDPFGTVGEDVNFSRSCIKSGIEMYCDADLTLEVGHIGNFTFCFGQQVDEYISDQNI